MAGRRAIEHERPKALWELCCEHLLAERIVRPPVDALVRMIGAARERAHVTTHEQLSPQLQGGRPRERDRLLELREPGGVTWLEWLRTPADSSSPAAIRGQVEKYLHLDRLCAGEADLSMLAPGRVRMLALEGKRRAAWEITRLPPIRRHPLLLVFISQMFVERGDELIERYCTAIQNVERRARIAVREQRDTTARARDERNALAGTLSRILLDALDGGEDPLARALREVGESALRACVEDPDALSKPIDEQRRDAQHARHSQLAQFAPLLLGALDLKAARATSRCSRRSATATETGRSPCSPTRRLRCSPRSGDGGFSTRTVRWSAPGMSWDCGSRRAMRYAPAACTAPPATAMATRRAG